MALLGNIIWFVLGGWWNFLVYAAFGLLFCMTIIGIPIGKALFQYAKLMVLPFGKVIVKETELKGKDNVAAVRRVGGTIANILWLPFGVATFLANIGLMIVCAISIIGIPAAIVIARSCKFLLWPVGAKVVTKEEYDNLVLRRTIAASINEASGTPPCAPISYESFRREYEVGDFFSSKAWMGALIGNEIWSLFICAVNMINPLVNTGAAEILRSLFLVPILITVELALCIAVFPVVSLIAKTIRAHEGIRSLTGYLDRSSVLNLSRSVIEIIKDYYDAPKRFVYTSFSCVLFYAVLMLVVNLFAGNFQSGYLLYILFVSVFRYIPALIGFYVGANSCRTPEVIMETPEVSAPTSSVEYSSSTSEPVGEYASTPPQSNRNETVLAQNVLIKNSSVLWMQGLPLVVTKAYIVKNNTNSPEVFLQLELQNLSSQPVIAVYFSAHCSDLLRQVLHPLEKQSVQDFVLNPGAVWTVPQLIPLPDNDTRRIELTIHNVVMEDGSIWSNDAEECLSPIPEQLPLNLPSELSSELQKLKRENAKFPEKAYTPFVYAPSRGNGYWCCACGQVNISSECIRCGFSEETVFQITQIQLLTEQRENRLQEEARIREEKKQALLDKQEAIKETTKDVGRKVAAGGKTAAHKLGNLANLLRNKVTTLRQHGKELFAKYVPVIREKCANGFENAKDKVGAFYSGTVKPCAVKTAAFFKEKVFPHWKKILIVVVTVVLVTAIVDVAIEKYQEYRVEQARIQQEEAEEAARLEAERQQALAEEEARKQREEEELRRLEEEKRRLEEEKRVAEEKEKFEEGLPALFQTAFDSYSNGQVPEADRLAVEITLLKKLVSEAAFPWDGVYGSMYLSWRGTLIETMTEQLIIEYEEIIAKRTIYEANYNVFENYPYVVNGLYYAGYHDFDGNQLPELLLVTLEEVPSNELHPEYTAILEIYGEKDQKVVKYGSESIYMPYGEYSVELKRCQDNFVVYYSYHGYSSGAGAISKYFGVQNKQLSLIYDLSMQSYFINEYTRDYEYEYYNGNNKITSEQYSEILQKYVSETRIYYNECYEKGDHGVLTEPVNRTIIVNGQELTSIGPLYMDGEYTLAPLRPVLEAMGIPVCADGQLVTILASTKKDTLDIHKDTRGMPWGYGYYKADFNDTSVSIIAPEIIDGQMYVRIEPTVSLFGAAVQYSRTDRTFTITFDISSEDLMTEWEVEALLHFSYEDAEAILLQHGYWISGSEDEVDSYIYFKNGCAFWSVYVLPLGVEYEAYEEEWAFVGNSIHVTVTSNGELIW